MNRRKIRDAGRIPALLYELCRIKDDDDCSRQNGENRDNDQELNKRKTFVRLHKI
jgi:hypothetical protein